MVPAKTKQPTGSERKLTGTSPTNTADMNDLLEFELNRNANYELQIKNGESLQTQRFTTTDAANQLIEVQLND